MTDRPIPDIRAEMERLARIRAAMLAGKRSAVKGIPPDMLPPSGKGGDLDGNRKAEAWT